MSDYYGTAPEGRRIEYEEDAMSGYIDDEDYSPATRLPNAPGGDRVRFEREGEHEQSLWGGGAQDIEKSILDSTWRNTRLIGWVVIGVEDIKGDLGSGSLQELTLTLEHQDGRQRLMKITGIGMEVEIIE